MKEGLGRRKEYKEEKEEGVVYKVKFKDCDIREITFKMKKRIDQHKKMYSWEGR